MKTTSAIIIMVVDHVFLAGLGFQRQYLCSPTDMDGVRLKMHATPNTVVRSVSGGVLLRSAPFVQCIFGLSLFALLDAFLA